MKTVILFFYCCSVWGQSVISTIPFQNQSNVPADQLIEISLDESINPATILQESIIIMGSLSGRHTFKNTYYSLTKTINIDPTTFIPGEKVIVTLTPSIQTLTGFPINGYSLSFMIKSTEGTAFFRHIQDELPGSFIALNDYNADGIPEIYLIENGIGVWDIKNLEKPVKLKSYFFSYHFPQKASDYNNDGLMDFTSVNSEGIVFWLNDSDTSFTESWIGVEDNHQDPKYVNFESNNDGYFDIAVTYRGYAISGHGQVILCENNGYGLFPIMTTIAGKHLVNDVYSPGDLNNDGMMDLIYRGGGEDPAGIYILKNNGDKSFTEMGMLEDAELKSYGDFNNDRLIDLLIGNKVYLNSGDFTFTYSSTIQEGIIKTTGDFDGDGDLDLAGNYLFLNDGNANFTRSYYLKGTMEFAFDIDRDGDLDLISGSKVNFNRNNEQVLYVSDSSVVFPETKNLTPVTKNITIFNDGALDNLTVQLSTNTNLFTITSNNITISGRDSVVVPVTFSPLEGGIFHDTLTLQSNDPDNPVFKVHLTGKIIPGLSSIDPGNAEILNEIENISIFFNSDIIENTIAQNVFLFSSLSGKKDISVSYNRTNKKLELESAQDYKPGEKLQIILNDDIRILKDNLPLIDGYSSSFNVLPRSVLFKFVIDSSVYPLNGVPVGVEPGDFNKDDFIDFAVANNQKILVFINAQNGTFHQPVEYTAGLVPQNLVVMDYDSDSDPDIIAINSSSNNITRLLNDGTGKFASDKNFLTENLPRAAASGDLNNDGFPDLVVANFAKGSISIYNNTQGTGFSLIKNFAVGANPSGVVLEDLNNDGKVDIAVSKQTQGNVGVILSDAFQFNNIINYPAGNSPSQLYAFDFDNDKDYDLATINAGSESATILINDGMGIFDQSVPIPLNGDPLALYCNDLDGDKDIDLVVSQINQVNILTNNGSAFFTTADSIQFDNSVSIRKINAIDIANTGTLQLLLADNNGSGISVLRDTLVVIPVELVSFSGAREHNRVRLNWVTSTELNNKGFDVEKNTGNGWLKIGFVQGQGNSTEVNKYNYIDELSGNNVVRYRLKQIDFNGSYRFSSVVSIEIKPDIYSLEQNYPNPFNAVTRIRYALPLKSNVRLTLYNSLGEMQREYNLGIQEAGYYTFDFDAEQLASGIYIYRINADNSEKNATFVHSKKLILLK